MIDFRKIFKTERSHTIQLCDSGVKSILMGFGLESDAIHSPNENFPVANFLKGIETIPYFYKYFTEIKK